MEKKLLGIEEIKKFSEKKHEGIIIKKLKINFDSKNYFVRIPKEIADHLKIKKEDSIFMELDTTKPIEEEIIECKLIKN